MAQTTTELILKTIVQGTEDALKKIKGVGTSLESASNKAKESSQFLAKWGAIAAGAVTAGAVLATKSFIDFEDQLANVRKTTGASSSEIKKIGDNLLQYSRETRSSIDELLSIGTIGGSLGVATKDIESFTKAVDKVNVALADEFSGGVEHVTKSVSGLRLIFKEMQTDNIADDLLKIGNALNIAGNVGAATGEVVSDFASRIGGVAAPLGFTTGQVLGLSAAMQELQIEPERGSGAFTQIIQKMGQDIAGFAEIAGMSVSKFKQLYNTDINGAFLAVAKGISSAGTSNTKFIETLNKVGLDGIRTSEVIGKLGGNIGLVTERQKQLTDATKGTASIMSEFDVKNNTAAANLAKLRNSVNELGVNFVSTFGDTLNNAIQGLTKLVQGIPDVINKISELYNSSLLFRSGVIVLAGAIVGALIPALVALGAAAAVAFVALAPFMLSGVLMAGLVAGAIWLYNNWDTVTGKISALWQGLKTLGSNVWSSITGTIKQKIEEAKNWINTKLNNIKTFFSDAWEFIKAIPGKALEYVKKSVQEKLDTIKEFFTNIVGSIRDGLESKVSAIRDWCVGLPLRMGKWLISSPAYLLEAGANLAGMLADGIAGGETEVGNAARGVGQTVADYLELHSPAKKGPLSTADQWMPRLGNMLASGLAGASSLLKTAIAPITNIISTNLGSKVFEKPKAAISEFSTNFKSESTNIKSTASSVFGSLESEIVEFQTVMDSFPENLQGNLKQGNDAFKSFSKQVLEDTFQLKDDFEDKMQSFAETLSRVTSDIRALNSQFAKDTANQNKNFAEQFLNQQKKLLQIREEISMKQREIEENTRDFTKRSETQQYDSQVSSLDEQRKRLEQEIENMQERMRVKSSEDDSLRDQESANAKREQLQRQINGVLLEMSKLRLKAGSEKNADEVDVIKRKMNELAYTKKELEQEMADVGEELAKKTANRIADNELNTLKNRKKQIDDEIGSLQATFELKNNQEREAEDQRSLEQTRVKLASELEALQSKLTLEQSALKRARDYESQLSAEIREAKKRDRQSEFTNFLSTWNEQKNVLTEEYTTKLNALERESEAVRFQSATTSAIYTENQRYIQELYVQTRDAYLSTLNEQTVGTKYYTELMSSYFENVGSSIRALSEQPFLEGTKKFSSVNPQQFGFDQNGQILPKAQIERTPVMESPQIANVPVISSAAARAVSTTAKPTQTFNLVVDKFIGEDSYARKLFDGFTKQIKKTLAF